MNINTQFKGHKRLRKIKTWTEKNLEQLSSPGMTSAVLVKVRSMFPQGGSFFGLKLVGAEDAKQFFNTQFQAHCGWRKGYKIAQAKTTSEVGNAETVQAQA